MLRVLAVMGMLTRSANAEIVEYLGNARDVATTRNLQGWWIGCGDRRPSPVLQRCSWRHDEQQWRIDPSEMLFIAVQGIPIRPGSLS